MSALHHRREAFVAFYMAANANIDRIGVNGS